MSNVDITVPVEGEPTTLSLRNNFSTIKTELEVLESVTPSDQPTAAETAAGVTPTNYEYPERHLFRYIPTGEITTVQAGTSTTDLTTYIQNGINVGPLFVPDGSYHITAPLVFKGVGPGIIGQSRNAVIIQDTNDTPILQLGDASNNTSHGVIQNIQAKWNSQQTTSHTSSIAIYVYSTVNQYKIDDVWLRFGYSGVQCRGSGTAVLFNSDINNVTIGNFVGYGYNDTPSSTAISGNKIGNLYISGSTGATNTTMVKPFKIGTSLSSSVNQLNIEHCFYTDQSPIEIASSQGVDIGSIHIEDIESASTANFNSLIQVSGDAVVNVDGITIQGWTLPATIGTNPGLVHMSTTGPRVEINSIYSKTSTISVTPFCLATINDQTEFGELVINNANLDMTVDQLSYAKHTTYPLVIKYNDLMYMKRWGQYDASANSNKQPSEGNVRELYVDAAPQKGLYDSGSVLHIYGVSAGEQKLICYQSGGLHQGTYSGVTTYFYNEWVKGSDNKVYKAIQHNFSGQDPTSAPTYWTEAATQEALFSTEPRTATTTELEDVSDTVNTSALKIEGYRVFNTTTNKPVWAAGNADGDVWVDATGATAHTPV